jgi:hypothetical protein
VKGQVAAQPRKAARPSADYLLETMRMLWPAPSRVTAGGPRRQASPTALEFIALPSTSQPKLVIPRRPRTAAAAAVRGFKTSASPLVRLQLRVAGMAVRFGAAEVMRDRIHVEFDQLEGRDDITSYLGAQLGRDLTVALYIGPIRAVQKPILQLLTADGRVAAFAKIGTNELTRALVRNEALALTRLSQRDLPGLKVPAVVHHGQWRGHEVLVQEALAGSGQAPAGPAALSAAMVQLAAVSGVEHQRLVQSPYWQRLRRRVEALPPGGHAIRLLRVADHIQDHLGDRDMGFGAWHGDWAPWNMTAADGQVLVWDWEGFEEGVPLGFDAVHHEVQREVVDGSGVPAKAFAGVVSDLPRLLAPFGVDAATGRLIVLLYVMHLSTGYLESGESATRLAQLDTWLAPELDRHLELVLASSLVSDS